MTSHTELAHYIEQQNVKRQLWDSCDTPEALASMLEDESKELAQSIQEAFVTSDVFSVASEIGDIQYLLLRLGSMLGIDPIEAGNMKLIRNSYKYPDHLASNGRDLQPARTVMKESWNGFGGDKRFSHIYLDLLAQ
jgi:NTP pyrophosphatase (non-canonical NTP hydrolase)